MRLMDTISLVERGMTDAEFARMTAGFDEHTREQDNPIEVSDRHDRVATDGDAYDAHDGSLHLTDLFVEKPYRGRHGLLDVHSRV